MHLSAEAHYATPGLSFDTSTEKGSPFAYHVYGTAYLEATVDRLLGNYRIDSVKIVHDGGGSVDQLIDRGQIEGGLAQGIGWMTLEEIRYDEGGRILTATPGTYKVPDLFSAPERVEVEFLPNEERKHGLLNAKAVGEPPFLYGIGAYFALRNAVETGAPCTIHRTPLTPEYMFSILEREE